MGFPGMLLDSSSIPFSALSVKKHCYKDILLVIDDEVVSTS